MIFQENKVYRISYIDRGDKKHHHVFIATNEIKIEVLTESEVKAINPNGVTLAPLEEE